VHVRELLHVRRCCKNEKAENLCMFRLFSNCLGVLAQMSRLDGRKMHHHSDLYPLGILRQHVELKNCKFGVSQAGVTHVRIVEER